jgi:SAM-dependent methyltransferase
MKIEMPAAQRTGGDHYATGDFGGQLTEAFASVGELTVALRQISEKHADAIQELHQAIATERNGRAEIERTVAAQAEALRTLRSELDSICDTRDAAIETRTIAEQAARRMEAVSGALDSVYRIFSEEIRPMGFLFPFAASSVPAETEEYKQFLGRLKTEPVRSCLVCGSTTAEPVGVRDGLSLHRCGSCGFIFPNPRIAEDQLGALYGAKYWDEHQRVNGLAAIRDRMLFDYHFALTRLFMIKAFRSSGRFLDIGCAAGALVRRAQEFGYKSCGLEIDPQITAVGREFFGIKIFTGRIETVRLWRRSFDIVTMYDVFEHLYDPDRALRRVHDILARRGLLVIETFHTDCADFERSPLQHPDCKPLEHVGMYRDEHIDQILTRNKFTIIETRYPQGASGSRIIKIATKIA